MKHTDYHSKQAPNAEVSLEDKAPHTGFGKEMDSGKEPKRRAKLANGVWTEMAGGTYHWGMAPGDTHKEPRYTLASPPI